MIVTYLAPVCSQKLFDQLFDEGYLNSGQQVQKYHSSLIKGINKNNTKIEVIGLLKYNVNISKETFENIEFNYVTSQKGFKGAFSTVNELIKIIENIDRKNHEKSLLLVDSLNLSLSLAAYFYSTFHKSKTVSIITDLPEILTEKITLKFRKRLYAIIHSKFLSALINQHKAFVILSEAMILKNKRISKNKYIVLEGQIDVNEEKDFNYAKSSPRSIVYAGSLAERNGIKVLLDAFAFLDDLDISLELYGSGDYSEKIVNATKNDNRIHFHGLVHNSEVIKSIKKATLLVNPRNSKDDFTKYSFPSKTIEYMFSGTPLLTNKLQSIPKEYFNYLFINNDESPAGLAHSIRSILEKSDLELSYFGKKSRDFIINEKSNVVQASRLLDFLEGI